VSWGANLQSEHERYLTEEHFKCPVTVYNYPRAIKAFYMRQTDGCAPDRQTVAAMDLLVPGIGEIIGGSQREERLDKLREGMALHHLDEKAYWWYLDLRRYGTRAARRLRPRLRAHADVRHGRGEHPRRDPVCAHAGHGGFLRRNAGPRPPEWDCPSRKARTCRAGFFAAARATAYAKRAKTPAPRGASAPRPLHRLD
jgi:hypothetical protein